MVVLYAIFVVSNKEKYASILQEIGNLFKQNELAKRKEKFKQFHLNQLSSIIDQTNLLQLRDEEVNVLLDCGIFQ